MDVSPGGGRDSLAFASFLQNADPGAGSAKVSPYSAINLGRVAILALLLLIYLSIFDNTFIL
jgi:hypothetical protein